MTISGKTVLFKKRGEGEPTLVSQVFLQSHELDKIQLAINCSINKAAQREYELEEK